MSCGIIYKCYYCKAVQRADLTLLSCVCIRKCQTNRIRELPYLCQCQTNRIRELPNFCKCTSDQIRAGPNGCKCTSDPIWFVTTVCDSLIFLLKLNFNTKYYFIFLFIIGRMIFPTLNTALNKRPCVGATVLVYNQIGTLRLLLLKKALVKGYMIAYGSIHLRQTSAKFCEPILTSKLVHQKPCQYPTSKHR